MTVIISRTSAKRLFRKYDVSQKEVAECTDLLNREMQKIVMQICLGAYTSAVNEGRTTVMQKDLKISLCKCNMQGYVECVLMSDWRQMRKVIPYYLTASIVKSIISQCDVNPLLGGTSGNKRKVSAKCVQGIYIIIATKLNAIMNRVRRLTSMITDFGKLPLDVVKMAICEELKSDHWVRRF